MTTSQKRALQLIVSLIVAAACLWFAFAGVVQGAEGSDLSADAMLSLVRGVPLSTYGVYCVLFVVQIGVRVERWRVQTRGLTGTAPPWLDALAINAIAFAAVFLIPFRLGEFVRPNLCARRGIMPASSALAASALERILDGLVTTAIFGVLLVAAPFEWPSWVRAGGLSALALFGGAIIVLVVAARTKDFALKTARTVLSAVSPKLAERVVGMLGAFLDGLSCFRRPIDLGYYLGLSVVFWLVNGLGTAVMIRALDPSASYWAGFVCLCFLVIGVMLPAPPGNVGSYHAFAKLGMTVSGVAALPATAGAVLMHLLNVVAVVGLALVFAVIGPFRMADAKGALDETANRP